MRSQRFELFAFSLDLVFSCNWNDFQRNFVEIGPGLDVRVIADDDGNFAGEFPAVLAIKQIDQAVIVARDEDRDFGAICGEGDAPLHLEAVSDGLEMLREFSHVDGEAGHVPFDAHEKEISLSVQMLVGMESVAVRAINEIVDRGVEAFLVGAADQKDAGVLHAALLLMITRDGFLPGFVAYGLAIFD